MVVTVERNHFVTAAGFTVRNKTAVFSLHGDEIQLLRLPLVLLPVLDRNLLSIICLVLVLLLFLVLVLGPALGLLLIVVVLLVLVLVQLLVLVLVQVFSALL